ncbi:hypothetical protein OROGR_002965 [Orobanche gracilis]
MWILHAQNPNKNAWKALIAAEFYGVKVEMVKEFQMGLSNKTPEFLKMNPMGKVPVLETPDGCVFESNAIARYVTKLNPENSLFGSSAVDYVEVTWKWIDFAALEIDANIGRWLYPRLSFALYLPPLFWEMYDPEGYSLWFCNYKYNEENTVSFVTMNKVGGFLQRMDLARKYAFGKMLVIGSQPPYKVQGLWLFRGKEIPKFVMDVLRYGVA